MKRKILTVLVSMPLLSACISTAGPDGGSGTGYSRTPSDRYGNDHAMRAKFKGIGVGELILDAVNKKEGVTFYNEVGDVINATGTLGPKRVDKGAYPGGESGVPKTIRATWRTGEFEQKAGGGGWEGGTMIADYTIQVAERIPNEVLNYIRKNGGALRIKLRLKDDGIMLGWDVQRRVPIPGVTAYMGLVIEMPGGDFLDTEY